MTLSGRLSHYRAKSRSAGRSAVTSAQRGFNLVDAIAGVGANDVDSVREQFPSKFDAVRPLLLGGKLARLRELARNVRTLFDILVDPTFSVPWRTTAAIVAALGYFVLSFDVVPDVIPVLGFLDDALVVAEVVYLLSGDVRRYREHRANADRASAARGGPKPATSGDERLVA